MIEYTVEITDEALNDMEQLYNYITFSILSPENAIEQYNRIAEAILKLDTFPECFQVMESEPEFSKGIRRMVVDNYSVFYVVQSNRVIVTDVLYSASDIDKRLKS